MADDVYDDPKRLRRLIDAQTPVLAAGFRTMVGAIKDQGTLDQIAGMLERRLISEALQFVLKAARKIEPVYLDAFVAAAEDTATFLGQSFKQVIFDFDRLNPWAVQTARENQLRLVREFSASQVRATHEALLDGVQRGLNPREQARAFRDSIGLTQKQVRIINNYRRNLEEGDSRALDRALRDRRFDPTVRRAVDGETTLSRKQIDRMVGRYRERWLKYRSEVIGRTESMRSVHQGNNAMYEQAMAEGSLPSDGVEQSWESALDERVRGSHATMHGQIQPFGTPFISGLGNQLLYPGDPNAPAEDVIQCRCTLGTRITTIEAPAGMSVEILGA